MIFETYTLNEPLTKYIESIFYYKGLQPDHSIERVVPTGHLFILFELDGIERSTFDNDTLKPNGSFTKVWLSGMHKKYISISAHPDSEMLVVQFKPYGAHPFLHMPINELNDKVVPGQDICGVEILTLQEEVKSIDHHTQKFDRVGQWLHSKLDQSRSPSDELVSKIEELAVNPMSDHTTVVNGYSKTQKHLIEQCKKHCGLTPKVIHRIFRFNQVLQQIHQNKKIVWSQIAYQFGYTDQSHFIKEFKEFSGFNPQEFIIAEHHNEPPNFFPLDRQG